MEPIRLSADPLEESALRATVSRPDAGAVVTFAGTVRNHHEGRQVTHLLYEAYGEMARQQMQQLRAEALERFDVLEAALHHRVGRLEIGETSVMVAVSAAHRAAAFEACRYLIDTLKATVPIWKKEYYADPDLEPVWVDPTAKKASKKA